ncbi:MAG: hypothetical protein DRR06_09870 [Gammaproteobacteria bacterium]|nr:MAG: hypothetical protein DRR06_09870 [Gammaproteobacteria bacterium]
MEQCKHELPESQCAICLGRWNHDIVSPTTGKIRTSREYIPWFVPSTLDRGAASVHPKAAADRLVPSDGAAPGSSIKERPALPVIQTPSADMEIIGRPRWYREQVMGEESIATRVTKATLDYYGFMELHVAEILATLEPESVIEPVPTIEPAPKYRGTDTDWTAWRQARRTTPIGV